MSSLKKMTLILLVLNIFLFVISDVRGKEILSVSYDDQLLFARLREKGFSQNEIVDIFTDERFTADLDVFYEKKEPPSMFTEESIVRGVKCFETNKNIFDDIKQRFGVEGVFLVGIYRIETDLGMKLGKYKVINALLTRWKLDHRPYFFFTELVSWLELCKKYGFDYFSMCGSSAGAFGKTHFMPSNYLRYGIDADKKGKIDLFEFKDAMYSTANFLKGEGWRDGDLENNKRVLWKYNHSDAYVDAIVRYVLIIKKRLEQPI